MPGPAHQNLVLLFSRNLELVFEFARLAGAPLDPKYEDLREVPREFDIPLRTGDTVRSDVAVAAYRGEKAQAAIILEVQTQPDPGKQWSMLLYRAGIRYHLRCAAWTVVFSPEQRTLTWARTRLFSREPELAPFVIAHNLIPLVTSLDRALADYPRAVLAAVIHGRGPDAVACATAAIRALLRIAPRDYERYIQLVTTSITKVTMQQVREQLPAEEKYTLSEWERSSSPFTTGHEEGLEQGREQGLEQGLRTAIFTVLAARGLEVDDETRARILATEHADKLQALAARAATVTSLAELFA